MTKSEELVNMLIISSVRIRKSMKIMTKTSSPDVETIVEMMEKAVIEVGKLTDEESKMEILCDSIFWQFISQWQKVMWLTADETDGVKKELIEFILDARQKYLVNPKDPVILQFDDLVKKINEEILNKNDLDKKLDNMASTQGHVDKLLEIIGSQNDFGSKNILDKLKKWISLN